MFPPSEYEGLWPSALITASFLGAVRSFLYWVGLQTHSLEGAVAAWVGVLLSKLLDDASRQA
eukprot:6166301-Lingulodinium_polyedra.AAC.1